MDLSRQIPLALAATLLIAAPATADAADRTKHGVSAKISAGTLRIAGNRNANKVTLRAGRGNTIQVDVGSNGSPDVSFKRSRFRTIVVNGGAGNDRIQIDDRRRAFTTGEPTTLNGQAGNDRLTGGRGGETLNGGAGADTVVAGRGNDSATLGSGADTFEHGRGDGADAIDGQGGSDTVRMRGSSTADTFTAEPDANGIRLSDGGSVATTARGIETVSVRGGAGSDRLVENGTGDADQLDVGSAAGGHVQIVRAKGSGETLDADDIEALDVAPAGGPDTVAIGPLAGTDLTGTNVGLSNDGQPDAVTLQGTPGDDALQMSGSASGVNVTGAGAPTAITQADPTGDRLTVDGSAGADTVDAGALTPGSIGLTLEGGAGADTLTGSPGDDTFRWDDGDGSDRVEGAAGADRLSFNGSAGAERFAVSPDAARVAVTRDIDSMTTDAGDVEALDFNPGGGSDDVTVNGSAAADKLVVAGDPSAGASVTGVGPAVSVKGGDPAADTLTVNALDGADNVNAGGLAAGTIGLNVDGGLLADTLIGSPGRDVIDGGPASDTALMGDGDDTFRWDPGDGSDTVDGEGGSADTLLFNGGNVAEGFDLSANGTRLHLTRNVGTVVMDCGGVEAVQENALGGADTTVVNDLTATEVKDVRIDLAGTPGGDAGDGDVDSVLVIGTSQNDTIDITGSTAPRVTGLGAAISIVGAEPAADLLTVNGQLGSNTLDASPLAAGLIKLSLVGGPFVDALIGSQGDDSVDGRQGDDVIRLGPGDDLARWDPGDANDTVQGQGGADTLLFNGSNASEDIDLAAQGARVRLFRNVASVTMTLDGVETVDLNSRGGVDRTVVNDLTGSGLSRLDVDLAGQVDSATGDGAADDVFVVGTAKADTIGIAGSAGTASVSGLPTAVSISHAEAASDRVTVNGLGGDDAISGATLTADAILLTIHGGDGDDVLIGGAGNDTITGDNNDDVLLGEGGVGALDGGSGNNVIVQD
jgi:Ca2+-binding RTX toxin-like protein